MESLLVLLGIALFLLGLAATACYSMYEYHDQKRINPNKSVPTQFFFLMGFLSLIPLVVYLLILVSNHQSLLKVIS